MIAWLEGVLREQTPTRVVIAVNGVGYEVLIPLSTFVELPDEGKTVALHVHTHAREGSLQLYGFHTLAERCAFELLLRANRVGPRLAQTVLSGIAPGELLHAIRQGDTALLRAVPGVGAKVAERILVELRDRADELAAAVSGSDGGATVPARNSPARDQALSALQNLGYPKTQAERLIDGAEQEAGPDFTLETLVRAALRRAAP